MSIRQSSGTSRNGSAMTGYRHDLLPFGLENKIVENRVFEPLEPQNFSREKFACPESLSDPGFRLYSVRLCPRAAARIRALLAFPGLHDEVRSAYTGLLVWASD